jgi:hypothetical protein
MIREEHRGNMQGNLATLPLPSADKERLKAQVIERLTSAECASLLDQARRHYVFFAKFSQSG